MSSSARTRRVIAMVVSLIVAIIVILTHADNYQTVPTDATEQPATSRETDETRYARDALDTLAVKGRAPSTGYQRSLFGNGWRLSGTCDTRNIILARDMVDEAVSDDCKVLSGVLHDPYTGHEITFVRGADTSQKVQIDHVVALSDAWQKGAQQLSEAERIALANDPLELLAVDGPTNQDKSNGDAATWLPPNKAFRCQYIARQIAVKVKYHLWVTQAEWDAMARILATCPMQTLPQER